LDRWLLFTQISKYEIFVQEASIPPIGFLSTTFPTKISQSFTCVEVGRFDELSEVGAVSIFRIEINKVSECPGTYMFWFNRSKGGRVAIVYWSRPMGTLNIEM
jgi:hypothetical protein